MNKSYIWPLINRVSHILLIIFLVVSYFTGHYKRLLDYHVAFGYVLGIVFLFRILWGFVGPKYSRFRDLNFSISDLKDYMLNVLNHMLLVGKKDKEHVGHNPASSFAIIAMIVLTFLSVVSGVLELGIQKNHGILSFLHHEYFRDMDLISRAHSLFANLLIAVIVAHVAGSLIDKYIKKSDAIESMISGYKKTAEKINIKLNIFQKIFSIIWILASLFSLYYLIFAKNNIFIRSANVKQNYSQQNKDFTKECGSCHFAYPPFLLPKRSWVLMMKHLDNHFGEDASLDKATNLSILAFLTKNSAENSRQEAALKILKSLKGDNTTIAVTKTPFWKKRHKHIKRSIFKSSKVKSKANCKACHKGIQNGLIEDNLINIPHVKG